MRYWITTHGPRFVGERGPREGIWVQDGKRPAILPMEQGDLAFIYETQSGRPVKGDDGKVLQRQAGAQGVVALVKVDSEVREDDSGPDEYADGQRIWWRWYASTRTVRPRGFVSRNQLAKIVGYSPDYTFRGFGAFNSGLKEIPKGVFEKISAEFAKSG